MILGCFTSKPHKFGVGIGFSMQMKMLNISKTVTDSVIVCMGASWNPYAASSDPALHITLDDLEPNISRSSVFRNNAKWRVMAKGSEISSHIVWGVNRNPCAASSNPSLHFTWIDPEPNISRSSVFRNNDK